MAIPASLSLTSYLIMLFATLTTPVVDPKYQTAANTAFRATLEEPPVKEHLNLVSKTGEKMFWRYSPVTEKQLAYAAYVSPFMTGQISTKPIAGFKYVTSSGLTIRPDIVWNFKTDQSYIASLTITKGF